MKKTGWGFTAALLACAAVANADDRAFFVSEGGLVVCDDAAAKSGGAVAAEKIVAAQPITGYFGTDTSGRPVVALGEPVIEEEYDIKQGVTIAVLDDAGNVVHTIAQNVLRAYPSPSGTRFAVIGIDYRVSLVTDAGTRALAFNKPVTLVAWAPDESALCLTAYVDDWTPQRSNNPVNTEDFLRLQNSDLHLYALADDSVRQLTDAPGYDYNGVFEPGGERLFFISSRTGRGAFYSLDLATGAIEQRTNLAPGSYTVPVGRSDTFSWSGSQVVYEAQELDGGASVRSLNGDGTAAQTVGFGRQPQILGGGRVAYLTPAGTVEVKALSTTGKEQ